MGCFDSLSPTNFLKLTQNKLQDELKYFLMNQKQKKNMFSKFQK